MNTEPLRVPRPLSDFGCSAVLLRTVEVEAAASPWSSRLCLESAARLPVLGAGVELPWWTARGWSEAAEGAAETPPGATRAVAAAKAAPRNAALPRSDGRARRP